MTSKGERARICTGIGVRICGTRRYRKPLRAASIIALLWMTTATALWAQFTTVATFDGVHGGNPELMALAQGLDGNFYGTTYYGGSSAKGVVFKLSGGAISVLHNFTGAAPDGEYPNAGLLLATSGLFYGTTELGGANNGGTVFDMTPAGALATIHSFTGADGLYPDAPLIQNGGNFYGTTSAGGTPNQGTAFHMTGAGAVLTLHSFVGFPTDGAVPRARLLYAANGSLYGTTLDGGTLSTSGGSVFSLTTAGVEAVVQSFTNNGGNGPAAGLIQGLDGSFYGTTIGGGPANAGTLFKISPDGKTLTTLHNFGNNNNDAAFPYSPPVLATDGNLYGVTMAGIGSANAYGTIYRISTKGTNYSILYPFTNLGDGAHPKGGLIQGTDGAFYGTTVNGPIVNNSSCLDGGSCGVIFRFSAGLGPFVKALPGHAAVGVIVKILGNNLLGTTAVDFNHVPALFNIISATQINATVPAGATTGYITVTTPAGVLSSNVPFHVP